MVYSDLANDLKWQRVCQEIFGDQRQTPRSDGFPEAFDLIAAEDHGGLLFLDVGCEEKKRCGADHPLFLIRAFSLRAACAAAILATGTL